jgi:hypothetical protein
VTLSRRITLLTPITLAAGLLATVVAVSAADTRWTSTGAQQPGSPDRPVWSIAVSPTHPAVLLAATQGRGVLRSTDSGATWTSAIVGVDGAWVVRFDPLQPATAYAGTQTAGLYKSLDEGKTWTAQSQGLNNMDVRSIAFGTGLVVAGTAQGVYYSSDGAGSWHTLGLDPQSIAAVGVLPNTNGFTLFAGIDNGPVGAGFLMKSEGLGGSWAVAKGSFPADAVVASLAVASAGVHWSASRRPTSTSPSSIPQTLIKSMSAATATRATAAFSGHSIAAPAGAPSAPVFRRSRA